MWNFLEKQLFFQADMAGLGKYRTDGFGRIGVYRVSDNLYIGLFPIKFPCVPES